MLHLKLLEKQEQAKLKTSRKREIMKIRAQVNNIKTIKTIQRINGTKSCLKKQTNKQDDKPLISLTKMRREKIQIDKIRNEQGKIITNTKEI
jgi:hypothetical protein